MGATPLQHLRFLFRWLTGKFHVDGPGGSLGVRRVDPVIPNVAGY